MKIIFLLPHLKISGGIRIILGYADRLSTIGHNIIVASEYGGFKRFIYNFLNKTHPFLSRESKVKLLTIKHFNDLPKADIVVGDSWSVAQKLYYSKAQGVKFHTIQHDERLYHGPRYKVEQVYKLPMKKIVVSSWLKEVLKNEYGSNPELLLNPIDRNLFYPQREKSNDKYLKILMLHHNYKWKGTEEGVSVVQELKKKYTNIKLILFGVREKKISLPYDEYYYNLPQEKLAWLYSRADIYLCPSWDEGSGLPSMEAMACKCALVTYDNGGSRDYAFSGKTAMVAKRRDVNDLKNKLELLIKDDKLRSRMAENGYNFIQQMPTWEEQIKKIENIFKNSLRSNA
jgi:hypothetical protein